MASKYVLLLSNVTIKICVHMCTLNLYCPEDRKPVGNNKNIKKNHPCAYVVYFIYNLRVWVILISLRTLNIYCTH